MFWYIMQKDWSYLLDLEKKVLAQLFTRENWLKRNEWYVNTDEWTIWENILSWTSAKYRDDLLHIWWYKSIDLESSQSRWIFQFQNSTWKYFSIKYYKFFDNVYFYWIQEIITRIYSLCFHNKDVLQLVDNDTNSITEIFERILNNYKRNNKEKTTFYFFILTLMNLILSDQYCTKFWIHPLLNNKYCFDQQKNKKPLFNKFLIILYTYYQDFFKEKHNNKVFEKEIMYHSNVIDENNKIQFTRINLNTLDITTNDVNQLYIDSSHVMNKDNFFNKNIYLRFSISEEQMKNYEYLI